MGKKLLLIVAIATLSFVAIIKSAAEEQDISLMKHEPQMQPQAQQQPPDIVVRYVPQIQVRDTSLIGLFKDDINLKNLPMLEEIIKHRLDSGEIKDVNADLENGYRLLHLAAGLGMKKTIKRILAKDPYAVFIENNEGYIPYDITYNPKRLISYPYKVAEAFDPELDAKINEARELVNPARRYIAKEECCEVI